MVKPKIEGGELVLSNGVPVFVHDDGKEEPVNVAAVMAALNRAKAEAKERREQLDALSTKLKAFEDLDPDEARSALSKVKSIDAKRLIDSGEAEKAWAGERKLFTDKLSAAEKRAQEAEQRLHRELVSGGISRSTFVKESLVVPPDFVEAVFGKHAKIEDGRPVWVDTDGSVIFDPATGKAADADYAIRHLVSQRPDKDHLFRATQKSGSGAQPGAPGKDPSAKTIPRAEFDRKTPVERREILSSGVVPVD